MNVPSNSAKIIAKRCLFDNKRRNIGKLLPVSDDYQNVYPTVQSNW